MKRKANYWMVLLMGLIVFAGCSKSNSAAPVLASPAIQGNYSGLFILIHLNPKTGKLDTATASVILTLSPTNTFSVSGDTTKIQYPSYGTYFADRGNGTINFTDATVTKTTNLNAPKKHLNGTFLYQYNTPNLVITGSSDTLNYDYILQSF